MSVVSDASYSEPPEVFDDETPGTRYVTVNSVETKRTPSTDEKVNHKYLTFVTGKPVPGVRFFVGRRTASD